MARLWQLKEPKRFVFHYIGDKMIFFSLEIIFMCTHLLLQKIYDSRISTEFDNEVEMLLSIDHLNLVKMIGYMNEHDERILVVEYVPNGNLRQHLDGMC